MKRIIGIFLVLLCVASLCGCESKEEKTYQEAMSLMSEGKYSDAYPILQSIQGYKDVDTQIKNCDNAITYEKAMNLMRKGAYSDAYPLLESIQGYKDANSQLSNCKRGIILDACKENARREYNSYVYAVSAIGWEKPSEPNYSPSLDFDETSGQFVCDMTMSFSVRGTNPKFHYRYYGHLDGTTATVDKIEDLN